MKPSCFSKFSESTLGTEYVVIEAVINGKPINNTAIATTLKILLIPSYLFH